MEQINAFIKEMEGQAAQLIQNAPMSEYCTFRIGGPADVMCVPGTEAALAHAVKTAAALSLPATVLGNGSNILVSDRGVRGVVLRLMGGLQRLEVCRDGRIYCEAGVPLKRLCVFAQQQGLTGLEFAYGIPGTVGGAVYMNAGAYGGEIAAVLDGVRLLEKATGEITEAPRGSLTMAYRSTPFTDKTQVILGAYFDLAPGDPAAISARMEELLAKRKASQPLNYPSAGSTFKRPKGAYAAALIDGCGLKGTSVGGAEVSTKHAGFVVNRGGATAADVLALMALIQRTVYEKEGFRLEPEVEFLGEM